MLNYEIEINIGRLTNAGLLLYKKYIINNISIDSAIMDKAWGVVDLLIESSWVRKITWPFQAWSLRAISRGENSNPI